MKIGFLDVLTLLFIGLKLTGYITWSWFWVLFPTIVSIAIVFLALVLVTTVSGVKKVR